MCFSLCNDFRSHGCVFTTVFQRQGRYSAEEEKNREAGWRLPFVGVDTRKKKKTQHLLKNDTEDMHKHTQHLTVAFHFLSSGIPRQHEALKHCCLSPCHLLICFSERCLHACAVNATAGSQELDPVLYLCLGLLCCRCEEVLQSSTLRFIVLAHFRSGGVREGKPFP